MSATEALATYLTDHLGGAGAGVEMARRLADDAGGEPDAEVLRAVAEAVEEDRETLRGLVEKLGVGQHPVKQAAGWLAEKAQRIGVSETFTHNAHLTRLLQVETLSLGVEGKLSLWLALAEVVPAHPQLAEVDLPRLAARARDQRRHLEAIRLATAHRAFATAG